MLVASNGIAWNIKMSATPIQTHILWDVGVWFIKPCLLIDLEENNVWGQPYH